MNRHRLRENGQPCSARVPAVLSIVVVALLAVLAFPLVGQEDSTANRARQPSNGADSTKETVVSGRAPAVRSSFTFRVVHRRYVSHLLTEARGRRLFVTVILTHGPNYWAHKSRSHPLHAACPNSDACLALLKRLDHHLRTGAALGLRLGGSHIHEIIYYQPQ